MESSASPFQSNYAIDIKRIYVWENRDFNGNGHVLVINSRLYRSWTSILNLVTNTLKPAFGSVRHLISLTNQEYVRCFESLEPNGKYVALGTDRFKGTIKCYKTAKEREHSLSPAIRSLAGTSDKDIYRQTVERHGNIMLFVVANGNTQGSPCKVIFNEADVSSWSLILDLIAQTLEIPKGIHLFTVNGDVVKDPRKIQDGDIYVAVAANEHFIQLEYLKIFQYLLPLKEINKKQIKELAELPAQIHDPIIVNVMQNANYNMVGKSRSDGLTNINNSDRYGPICPGAKRRRADTIPVPVVPAKPLKRGGNRARADAKQLETPCSKQQSEKGTQWSKENSSTESFIKDKSKVHDAVIECQNFQKKEKLHRKPNFNDRRDPIKSTNHGRKSSVEEPANKNVIKCQNPCPSLAQKPPKANKAVPKKSSEINRKRQPPKLANAKGATRYNSKKLEVDKSKNKPNKADYLPRKTTNRSTYEPPAITKSTKQQHNDFDYDGSEVDFPNTATDQKVESDQQKSSSESYCSPSSCHLIAMKSTRTCRRSIDTETYSEATVVKNVNVGVAACEPTPEKSTSTCPIQCELGICKSTEKQKPINKEEKTPLKNSHKASKISGIPIKSSCCKKENCPLAKMPDKKERRKCILSRLCSKKSKKSTTTDACTEPCSQIGPDILTLPTNEIKTQPETKLPIDQIKSQICYETCPELIQRHMLLNNPAHPAKQIHPYSRTDEKYCNDVICKCKHQDTATNNELLTDEDLRRDYDNTEETKQILQYQTNVSALCRNPASEPLCLPLTNCCNDLINSKVTSLEQQKSKFKFFKSKSKTSEIPKLSCRKVKSHNEASKIDQSCCLHELHSNDSKIGCFSLHQNHAHPKKDVSSKVSKTGPKVISCPFLIAEDPSANIPENSPLKSVKLCNIPSCCNSPEETQINSCCSYDKVYKVQPADEKATNHESKLELISDCKYRDSAKRKQEIVICPFSSKKEKTSRKKGDLLTKASIQYEPINCCSSVEDVNSKAAPENSKEKKEFCTPDSCPLKEKKTEQLCISEACPSYSDIKIAKNSQRDGTKPDKFRTNTNKTIKEASLVVQDNEQKKSKKINRPSTDQEVHCTTQMDLKSHRVNKSKSGTGPIPTCVKCCGSGKLKPVFLPAKSRGTDPIQNLVPKYQESSIATDPVPFEIRHSNAEDNYDDAGEECCCNINGKIGKCCLEDKCNLQNTINNQQQCRYSKLCQQPMTHATENGISNIGDSENANVLKESPEHTAQNDLLRQPKRSDNKNIESNSSKSSLSACDSVSTHVISEEADDPNQNSSEPFECNPTKNNDESSALVNKSTLDGKLLVIEPTVLNFDKLESKNLMPASSRKPPNIENSMTENNSYSEVAMQSDLQDEQTEEIPREKEVCTENSVIFSQIKCFKRTGLSSREQESPIKCPVLIKINEAMNLECPFKQRSFKACQNNIKQVSHPASRSSCQYQPGTLTSQQQKSSSNKVILSNLKCFKNNNIFHPITCPWKSQSSSRIHRNIGSNQNASTNDDEENKKHSSSKQKCFQQEFVGLRTTSELANSVTPTEILYKNDKTRSRTFCTNKKVLAKPLHEEGKQPEATGGQFLTENHEMENQIMPGRKEVLETPSEFIKDIIAKSVVVIDRYNLKPRGLCASGMKERTCPDHRKQSSGAESVCCSCPSAHKISIDMAHENFEYKSMFANQHDSPEQTGGTVNDKPKNYESEEIEYDKENSNPCVTTTEFNSNLNHKLTGLFADYAESTSTMTPVSVNQNYGAEENHSWAATSAPLQAPPESLFQGEKRQVSIMLDGEKPMVYSYSDTDSNPGAQDMMSAAMLFEQFRSEPESNIPSTTTVGNVKQQILVSTKAQCKPNELLDDASNALSKIPSPQTLDSIQSHLTKCYCKEKNCHCKFKCFGKLLNSISESPVPTYKHVKAEQQSVKHETDQKAELSSATLVVQSSSLSGLIVGENSSTYNGPAALDSSAATEKFSKSLESPTVDPLDMLGSSNARQKTESLQTMLSTFSHVDHT